MIIRFPDVSKTPGWTQWVNWSTVLHCEVSHQIENLFLGFKFSTFFSRVIKKGRNQVLAVLAGPRGHVAKDSGCLSGWRAWGALGLG